MNGNINNNDDICMSFFNERNIKPTAIRILILRTMLQKKQALSLHDMEDILETVDKSSISRTISLFLSHGLIHRIDDGSGSVKYAVCQHSCRCMIDDMHIHFSCTKCKKTFCMQQIPAPIIPIPDGFEIQSVNYVIKGICISCKKSNIH